MQIYTQWSSLLTIHVVPHFFTTGGVQLKLHCLPSLYEYTTHKRILYRKLCYRIRLGGICRMAGSDDVELKLMQTNDVWTPDSGTLSSNDLPLHSIQNDVQIPTNLSSTKEMSSSPCSLLCCSQVILYNDPITEVAFLQVSDSRYHLNLGTYDLLGRFRKSCIIELMSKPLYRASR